MQQAKNFNILPFYFFCLAGLVSCGSLSEASINSFNRNFGSNVTSIRDIKLEQDNAATVYLQGKVIRQAPLIDWRVYQLQDASGTIWVLTNKTEIQPGDQVLIQGKVHYQSIPIAGKDLGEVYIEEQKQLERIPAQ